MKKLLTVLLFLAGGMCMLPAAAQSFNAFEASYPAGTTNGVIKTKIAGSAFDASSGALRVVALSVFGTVDILVNATVTVNLISSSLACNTKTTLQSLGSVALVGGVGTLNPIVTNAYPSVRIQVSRKIGKITIYGCSNDSFAVRPFAFAIVANDRDWDEAGTSRALTNAAVSGGVVHGAGKPFTLIATAINAANGAVNSYAGTPGVGSVGLLQPDPATCSDCTPGTLSLGAWSVKSGVLTSSTASYTEAGSIALTLVDRTYANVDQSDSTEAERYIVSNVAVVGRFVPTAFRLQLNAPTLQTFGSSCPTRSFTYVGQPFGYALAPVVIVTAISADGSTAANYRAAGGLWSLNSPLAGSANACTPPPASNTCVVQRQGGGATRLTTTYSYISTGTVSGWDSGLFVTNDATLSPTGNGVGLLTLPASDRVALFRPDTPIPPFAAAVSLGLQLDDFSEAAGASGNPVSINGSIAQTVMPFDVNNFFRHGRVRLVNVRGSAELSQRMPMQIEHWQSAAAGWQIITDDACTDIKLVLDPLPSLWPDGSCVRDTGSPGLSGMGCLDVATADRRYKTPAVAGDFNLWLLAPGPGMPRRVTVTANVPDWLKFNWTGSIGNPVATAIFGSDREQPIIYERELY